ncbi:MAG: hypothetical protein ABH862_04095 [Candidatus Omnitrophota bacterium]
MKYKRIIYMFLIGLSVVVAAFVAANAADDSIEITASIDKNVFNIGDRIVLNVIVEDTSGYEIRFPEIVEKTGELDFVGSKPSPRKWNEPKKMGRKYEFTVYDAGTYVIPPVPVEFKTPEAETWMVKESPQVPLEVKSLLIEDASASYIKPIKGLLPYGNRFRKILIAVLSVLILAGAGLFIWMRKRRSIPREKVKEIIPAHIIAYEELSRLQAMNLPEKGLIKEYYTRLSDILRRYLENNFLLRAPEMTTEEFMETARASSDLNDRHKEYLERFLSHSDMVKFAKYGPTKLEMIDSFKLAEEFVRETAREEKESVSC